MKKVKITSIGEVRKSLSPVPRSKATLEAEEGEYVLGDINNDTLPELFKVGGSRHSQGGTPLELPGGSFVFSDTRGMRINDPDIIKTFGKTLKKGTKGYTPAELAGQYDINEYRKGLEDPDSDAILRDTAEKMIENYNYKLAQLAIAQESMKGFPQGIPEVAMPFMQQHGMSGEEFLGASEGDVPSQEQFAKCGAEIMKKLRMQKGGSSMPMGYHSMPDGSMMNNLNMYQEGATVNSFHEPAQATGYWDRVSQGNLFKRPYHSSGDPRMQEAIEKMIPFYGAESDGVVDYLMNILNAPQYEMNHLLTGLYESPATTTARYNNLNNSERFLIDLVADPLVAGNAPRKVVKWAGKKVLKNAKAAIPKITDAAKKGTKYLQKGYEEGIKDISEWLATYYPKVNLKIPPTLKKVGKASASKMARYATPIAPAIEDNPYGLVNRAPTKEELHRLKASYIGTEKNGKHSVWSRHEQHKLDEYDTEEEALYHLKNNKPPAVKPVPAKTTTKKAMTAEEWLNSKQ